MKKWLIILNRIDSVKKNHFKGSTLLFFALFLAASPLEAFNCNIQNIKETTNSLEWNYLWSVTSLCGNRNSNNLYAHLRFLNIDPTLEHRAIAQQTEDKNLDRFFMIIVSGRINNITDDFIPETLILEIANLQYSSVNSNNPFDQMESGLFIIKAELNGNFLDGFQLKNGTSRRLESQFAEEIMEYLRRYWQAYFDSVIFVEANNELAK